VVEVNLLKQYRARKQAAPFANSRLLTHAVLILTEQTEKDGMNGSSQWDFPTLFRLFRPFPFVPYSLFSLRIA
jgi:hypothetical protein